VKKIETNGKKHSETTESKFPNETLDKILDCLDEIMADIDKLRNEMEGKEKKDYEKSSIHMGEIENEQW
jgi:archaellum component FlaC